ncbi:MAG TPA: cobalamin B12-binding domain-containing protein [Myxococcota bacterium]|nr:cobalamin B12-binding domain-containing protein [Myxococcota bacterium]
MSESIRVLIAKPGLDGHDVGAKVLCRALMDAGMEVTYSGLRQSPQDIAAAAAQQRVHVLGLSVLSGAHLPLCEGVRQELQARGLLGELVWIVGGNVPRRDFAALEALGVAGVFPTGSDFEQIVAFILEEVAS